MVGEAFIVAVQLAESIATGKSFLTRVEDYHWIQGGTCAANCLSIDVERYRGNPYFYTEDRASSGRSARGEE